MMEDCELLSQFEAEGYQEAFGEIVRRHLDLVYSVAMRQVAGDEHLAKDVCQEVFVSLARKSADLKKRRVVSGWLYRAAKFEACRAVRNEILRRTREKEAGMENDLSESEPQVDWEQARPLLDEAIAELDESERDAICLRFYENRRFKEIGESLDLSENASRMRVNRSLDKLRDLLGEKGIKSSAATLAVALGGQASIAAPIGLAHTISASAVAVTGSGLLVTVLGIMNTTKIAGLVAVSVAAVGSAVYLAQDEENADLASEHRIEERVTEPLPETIVPQSAAESDEPESSGPAAPIETAEEGFERRNAELARLKDDGKMSDREYHIRAAILSNEFELHKRKGNASSSLTEEEKQLVKQMMELMPTDKEAASGLLIASLKESSSSAMYFLAGNTLAESGDTDKALDFYLAALDRVAGGDSKLGYQLYKNIGIIFTQKNKPEESKKYLQQAIYLEKKPDHKLHGLLGLFEVNTGNYAAAEYHYRQAVALNPEVQEWSFGLAKALVSQEKHKEAIIVLEGMLDRFAEK